MVEVALEGGWVLVRFGGDIDTANAPVIQAIVADLQAQGHRDLRIDLSRVEFMDARGLDLLAGAFEVAQQIGGRFEVINPTKQILEVLEASGMDRLIGPDRSDGGTAAAAG